MLNLLLWVYVLLHSYLGVTTPIPQKLHETILDTSPVDNKIVNQDSCPLLVTSWPGFPISKHSRDLKCRVYIMHFLLQSQHRNKQSLLVQLIFCLNHTLNFPCHLMVTVAVSPIQPNTILLLLWCGIEPTEIVLNFEKLILLIIHIQYDTITLGAPNSSLEHVSRCLWAP